jgi:hypothetical protein
LPLRKHFKSRFPAANVSRLNEIVATDTFFSDTPAADDGIFNHGGATMAQLFVGKSSQITSVFPMKRESQFAHTFEDFICTHGAPDALLSNNDHAQIDKQALQILRMYAIDDMQCEPHHQHQNYAERRIQEVKKMVNTIMDCTNTPQEYWLLCLFYVTYLLNCLAVESLNWHTPLQVVYGQCPDISALLLYCWFEPVYYYDPDHASFPSQSREKTGRWISVAKHKGDALTYWILTDNTHQAIARSVVRSANVDNGLKNHRAANSSPDGGEPSNPKPIVLASSDLRNPAAIDPSLFESPAFSPDELIGRYLVREAPDGQSHRALVARKIVDADSDNHQAIRFLLQIDEKDADEIISYNELCDLMEAQQTDRVTNGNVEGHFKFTGVIGHQGPLQPTDVNYKGSSWNDLVQWEDGSQT